MRYLRSFACVCLAFSLGLCAWVLVAAGAGTAQNENSTHAQEPEEYAVYNVILSTEYVSPKTQEFVINIETESRQKQPFIGFMGGLTPSGATRPTVQPDTLADFDAKNDKSGLLERRFDWKVQYILVTDDQLKTIFTTDANGHISAAPWDDFYRRYPGAPGVLAFSRVGLDSKRDEALVYVAIQSGLLGGSGRFFVLSKQHENWVVQKQVLIWLS